VQRQAIALGAAPLAAGILIPLHVVDDGTTLCPFREATGLPCPLCGATRAFVYAGHLDARAFEQNVVWVAVAIGLVVAGLTTLPRLRLAPVAVALGAVAWAWALAHQATIVT
jgi:hypothetical protein